MKVIIDRFEENYAVVEINETSFANLPLSLVPSGANEGSVIEITLDEKSTEQRSNNVSRLMDKLFKD